jgi:hypothetical protein
LTGYTLKEFLALLPYFRAAFIAHMEKYTVTGKPRRARRYSTYKNSPLPTVEDKLLFILVYLKQAATQELHGETFGMTQSVVNQWIHLLQPVLNQALAQAEMLPAREAEAVVWTDATEQADSVAVYFHDGTERAIPRPRKAEEQQLYYSGKKNATPSRIMSSSMPIVASSFSAVPAKERSMINESPTKQVTFSPKAVMCIRIPGFKASEMPRS